MRARMLRAGGWSLAAVLVILVGRTIAYAVSPSPIAELLQHRAGGPALPTLTLAALTAAASIAIAVTFLAWLGVRERAVLAERPAPSLRFGRMLLQAGLLAGVTAPLGGLLEAYIHWRAGLGWHGLHCVFGPVHRNLLPIDAALSLVAAAIATAVGHVVAWMRRTVERLGDPVAYAPVASVPPLAPVSAPCLKPRSAAGGARAPPVFS
jgi:hypothetical protein